MFKFLHAADIHLDSPLHKLDAYEGAPVEEFRGATRKAFDNLVKLALSERVDFVVLAGDLYDGDWKDYNTGLYLIQRMGRLRDAGIEVFVVAGNHDAASRITKGLRFPENVRIFPEDRPVTFEVPGRGVALHGQSFALPGVKSNLARKYPEALKGCFNIGVLHTCATGREGHEPYAPCSLEDLESRHYDYWALGHIHQHEVLSDDPPVVFSGNLQGRHIREAGPKGCVLVSVDDAGRVTLSFRTLDEVRWALLEVDASGMEGGYDLMDRLGRCTETLLSDNLGMPMAVRVRIFGETSVADGILSEADRWAAEVRAAALESGGGRVWVEKVRFDLVSPFSGPAAPSQEGALGELTKLFDEVRRDPSIQRSLMTDLLELERRLPRELREGPEGMRMEEEAWVLGLLSRVQPMLVRRLLRKGAKE